jgi:hypothetical protein
VTTVTAMYGPPHPATGHALEAYASALVGYGMVQATGENEQDLRDRFMGAWVESGGSQDDDVVFIRTSRARVLETFVMGVGWTLTANPGDGTEVVVTNDDRQAARDEFLETWNSERGADLVMDDLAFDRVG